MGLEDLAKIYPEDFGLIKCQRGFELAGQVQKRPVFKLDCTFDFAPNETKHNVLDKITDLAYLFHYIKEKDILPGNLNAMWKELVKQKPFSLYDRYDRRLFESTIELCLDERILDGIKSDFPQEEANQLISAMSGYKIKNPAGLFDLGNNFLVSLSRMPCFHGFHGPDSFFTQSFLLRLFFENNKQHYSGAKVYKRHFIERGKKSTSAQGATISAVLNCSAKHVAMNDTNCCITAPGGKWRDASILYWLDPAVSVCETGLELDGEHDSPFGLGIFVQATGYNVLTPENKSTYLVLEGFPSNAGWYSMVNSVKPFSLEINGDSHSLRYSEISVGRLVYTAGLMTARALDIPRLFVNTEHSGHQKSVEAVVREAAQLGSMRADMWELKKNNECRLLRNTRGEFSVLKNPADKAVICDAEGGPFTFTHYLAKSPLPDSLVKELVRNSWWRRKSWWRGEGFFDTWYKWNKFIMETYPKWPDALLREHPYAESVAKRGKDPQWNLGIGYCKGFEVDVKTECEKLGIK